MSPLSGNFGFMNILTTDYNISQSKIALKETATLKLGLTLVFINLSVY